MKYNLEVLNSREFEDLAKDLLDSELGVNFEIFKDGQDGGIDLRYSKDDKHGIIVQVKHYIKSKFSDLKESLKQEKNNLDKLTHKPKRYIVFTSCELNAKQADEIQQLLYPYVQNTGDIYGRDMVENLIANNHLIERKFFKLWLTSTNIMEQIIHNASINGAEFMEEKIKKRAKFYVQTNHLKLASQFLSENKLLIITGEPGVGKTTLAYMLVYELLGEGFELLYSDRNLRDVEHLIAKKTNKKQVILIDDFLGANLNDIYNPINPEKSIVNIVENIRLSLNKYLIFTSRTTLLSEANIYYEDFERKRISEVLSYELKVYAYSKLEKAKILYNHLFHFDLSDKFKLFFFEKNNYYRIIEHPNYYPRLIEYLTNEINYRYVEWTSIEHYVFSHLEKPSLIWQKAFENQLTRIDQLLIETLFTFGDPGVDIERLEIAFGERVAVEIENGGKIKDINPFNNCIKKLQEGFIKVVRNTVASTVIISFINPSLTDFMLGYLRTNSKERRHVWKANIYIEQYENRFGDEQRGYLTYKNHERDEYLQIFLNKIDILSSVKDDKMLSFQILLFMWLNFTDSDIENSQCKISELIRNICVNEENINTSYFSMIISNIGDYEFKETIDCVTENWDAILSLLLLNADDAYDLEKIVELNSLYNKSFFEYLVVEDYEILFHNTISRIFKEELWHQDFTECLDAHDDRVLHVKNSIPLMEEKAYSKFRKFLDDWKLSEYVPENLHLYELDFMQIIDDHIVMFDYNESIFEKSDKDSSIDQSEKEFLDIESEIERLFTP